MYEYTSPSDEPTHLFINGLSFDAPVTEHPKVGSSEIWYVINLTEDNHPLHVHLGLFVVREQIKLLDFDKFKDCMVDMNDAVKCNIHKHARGKKKPVPKHERGWKNVFKMMPGYATKIFVKFSYIHSNNSYPFDATKEPGYVYHCHVCILIPSLDKFSRNYVVITHYNIKINNSMDQRYDHLIRNHQCSNILGKTIPNNIARKCNSQPSIGYSTSRI